MITAEGWAQKSVIDIFALNHLTLKVITVQRHVLAQVADVLVS